MVQDLAKVKVEAATPVVGEEAGAAMVKAEVEVMAVMATLAAESAQSASAKVLQQLDALAVSVSVESYCLLCVRYIISQDRKERKRETEKTRKLKTEK
jgi:hypothetical protein